MRIGIIGAGRIGATLAEGLAGAGHEVVVANSRGPDTLRELEARLGAGGRAGTAEEAARHGEVVIEAVPFGAVARLPAEALAGRILVTSSNYFAARDGVDAELESGALSHSERVAELVPGARVVKAFNTIHWEHLRDQGDPSRPREARRAIFLAGDDEDAKGVVAGLIEELGFTAVDTGSLAEGGRRQQPGGVLFNRGLTEGAAARLLAALPG